MGGTAWSEPQIEKEEVYNVKSKDDIVTMRNMERARLNAEELNGVQKQVIENRISILNWVLGLADPKTETTTSETIAQN